MSHSLRIVRARIFVTIAAIGGALLLAVPSLAQQTDGTERCDLAAQQCAALPGGAIARLGTPRAVITGRFKALTPSPDGRWLAVVSENRSSGQAHIALLDAKTLALVRTIAPITDGNPVFVFSPDSRTLHTRQSSWSLDSGMPTARPVEGDLVGVSPNGKYWLINRPQELKLVVGRRSEERDCTAAIASPSTHDERGRYR